MESFDGKRSQTQAPICVNGTVTLKGNRVGDKDMGYVIVEIHLTESTPHRSWHHKSSMRLMADGQMADVEGDMLRGFQSYRELIADKTGDPDAVRYDRRDDGAVFQVDAVRATLDDRLTRAQGRIADIDGVEARYPDPTGYPKLKDYQDAARVTEKKLRTRCAPRMRPCPEHSAPV
ncbi:MAG: hypothetical protein M3N95_16435 [Actinomycetota bacterium]|nr:hypothetical protein [Actinomycetota bacterium]